MSNLRSELREICKGVGRRVLLLNELDASDVNRMACRMHGERSDCKEESPNDMTIASTIL